MMTHGISPGPNLITTHPDLYWGFIASMYVGNLVLLILNLPMVGLFVSVLRIPYSILYPIIIVTCVIGVYSVNSSIAELWIMFGAGIAGYFFRRNGFDPAPLILGIVLAPMFEMSLRQALTLSSGSLSIFIDRPIAAALLLAALGLAVTSVVSGIWSKGSVRRKHRIGLTRHGLTTPDQVTNHVVRTQGARAFPVLWLATPSSQPTSGSAAALCHRPAAP